MFLNTTIDASTRRVTFTDSGVAGIVNDYEVDGLILNLPDDTDYFAFSDAVIYVIFFDATGESHKQVVDLTDSYSGMPMWKFDNNILQADKTSNISFFFHMVIADNQGNVSQAWETRQTSLLILKNPDYDNEEEQADRETDIDRLAGLCVILTEAARDLGSIETILGRLTGTTPIFVDYASEMTQTDRLYVLRTDGYLYFYNSETSQWDPAVKYGATDIDATLTDPLKAAQAKVTGDRLTALESGKADASDVGDISDLETTDKTDLVAAVNEVKSEADTNITHIGNVENLSTTSKSDLVSAINEVDSHADANATAIDNLETAVDAVDDKAATNADAIGTLSNLTTDAKGNLVAAINEVDAHADANAQAISNLETEVDAVDDKADTNADAIGTLSNLTTEAKTNLVAAVNEVDASLIERTQIRLGMDTNGIFCIITEEE